MEILLIALAALLASGLTLFSGFGLGTLLLPVVALFFPIEVAVATTAVVHFANNVFKLGLMGRQADRGVVVRFGIPAVFAAMAGAVALGWLAHMEPLCTYDWLGSSFQVMPVKLVIGLVILVFACLEASPAFAAVAVDRKFLPLGGCVSGFFGGLSGHQGAFRSMFLLKAGLAKEPFIATAAALAAMVDLARLLVYGWEAASTHTAVDWSLVATASLAAFAGAVIGRRLLKAVTFRTIQVLVSVLLIVVALGLMSGIL